MPRGAPSGNRYAASKSVTGGRTAQQIRDELLDMKLLLSLRWGDLTGFADMAEAKACYLRWRDQVDEDFLERGGPPSSAAETFATEPETIVAIVDYWAGHSPAGKKKLAGALRRVRARADEGKPFAALLYEELGRPADYWDLHPGADAWS